LRSLKAKEKKEGMEGDPAPAPKGVLDLPDTVLRLVLSKLEAQAVLTASCTCKQLAMLCRDPALWRALFMSTWDDVYNPGGGGVDHRMLFLQRERMVRCLAEAASGGPLSDRQRYELAPALECLASAAESSSAPTSKRRGGDGGGGGGSCSCSWQALSRMDVLGKLLAISQALGSDLWAVETRKGPTRAVVGHMWCRALCSILSRWPSLSQDLLEVNELGERLKHAMDAGDCRIVPVEMMLPEFSQAPVCISAALGALYVIQAGRADALPARPVARPVAAPRWILGGRPPHGHKAMVIE